MRSQAHAKGRYVDIYNTKVPVESGEDRRFRVSHVGVEVCCGNFDSINRPNCNNGTALRKGQRWILWANMMYYEPDVPILDPEDTPAA